MMMMMKLMFKRLAQAPMLCVPVYNMKRAMMQNNNFPFYHVFSTYEMAADKRGRNDVFARKNTEIIPATVAKS
jgi:hypothetical protein